MKKLLVKLESCYGIKKLTHEFDFSDGGAFAIYAPNGMMKSSLAKTFQDIADGVSSKDCIFPKRVCIRSAKDEAGNELSKKSVFVIRPYDEVLAHTEKTSTLLVNSELRKEYEEIHADIEASTNTLIKALSEQSKSKLNLKKEIAETFTKNSDYFFPALIQVHDEVAGLLAEDFSSIPYDVVFDEKVLAFLKTKDFKSAIRDYVQKYNQLLSESKYFKGGLFNYYNASTVAKNLGGNGFFGAKHTVVLNGDEKLEISSEKELEEIIEKEKEGISQDADLKKKFAELEKQITKNANLRDFEAYIQKNEHLLPELENIEKFKEKVWKSYLKVKFDLFKDLVDKYQLSEKRKLEIEAVAAAESTQWESVIRIFNERFFVPFKLVAKNRTAVILGKESKLTLGFVFEDGEEVASVERSDLLQVLSTGEKKALYILNIIFEIEVRKNEKQKTVFLIDDIADSFDYKNKYAIVEYLRDISEEKHFFQIILTHNFDFFRTVNSRFVQYSKCLMALKSNEGIILGKAAGIKNIFVKDWKPNFFKDPKKMIASIPFIRNVIEYTKGEEEPSFIKLTCLLHWKEESAALVLADLDETYKSVFGGDQFSANQKKPVIDLILEEATKCLVADEGVNFENKIVLSIAIRLLAEKFMVEKINDAIFVRAIDANQTIKLFEKVKTLATSSTDQVDVLQRVVLMTPETIHLNSFMYEPIIDMSDKHLKRLFGSVSALI